MFTLPQITDDECKLYNRLTALNHTVLLQKQATYATIININKMLDELLLYSTI